VVHDEATGCTAAVDTPEVGPILSILAEKKWSLTHILNTHHHWDHTGGNEELIAKFPDVEVVVPKSEAHKIKGKISRGVEGGDTLKVGSIDFEVMDVGGHTLGHVAYYAPACKAAFVGDSIFALGCGRMFEGDYDQFSKSLERIKNLPDDTLLYCAHEYTAANAKFALTVEKNNQDLLDRVEDIKEKRSKNLPTVPTTVALEKATNPFIRLQAAKQALGLADDLDDVAIFKTIRKLKDNF